MSPPLVGVRVVEFASIGPGPHCAMLLADLGADVLRIDRPGGNGWRNPVVDRGRATLELDIRVPEGRDRALEIAAKADVLIEGNRPGVMERLGIGPADVAARNPQLVYGRMTGWGQDGPLARVAGHDINYIAIAGALAGIGEPGRPAVPPLNLIGDFGGGSMFLALGILAALWERERSGSGQVVDAAIVDGVSSLMSMFSGLLPSGAISLERNANLLGGAAPFYRSYLCSDGREVAVGALEPQFYRLLLKLIGAPSEWAADQNDVSTWPERSAQFAKLFLAHDRDHWAQLFEGTDACVTPILAFDEVAQHPQIVTRRGYLEVDGILQPAPAPRFSRSATSLPKAQDAEEMIMRWGTIAASGLCQTNVADGVERL